MSVIFDPTVANRDLQYLHPFVVTSWAQLQPELATALGVRVELGEGYRADARQRWLYAQGRTPEQCIAKGIAAGWARSGPIVTNAWSAKTSAHGYVLPQCTEDWPEGVVPAAVAIDLLVYDAAGKLWQSDAPWDKFIALTTDAGELTKYGLVHFHRPGVNVWDKPHLQRVEWNDATCTFNG